jgi:hypothetical protein
MLLLDFQGAGSPTATTQNFLLPFLAGLPLGFCDVLLALRSPSFHASKAPGSFLVS